MARHSQLNILIPVYYCHLLDQVNLPLDVGPKSRHLNRQRLALFDVEAQAAQEVRHRPCIKIRPQDRVAPGRPQREAPGDEIPRPDINSSPSNLASGGHHYQLSGPGQRRQGEIGINMPLKAVGSLGTNPQPQRGPADGHGIKVC